MEIFAGITEPTLRLSAFAGIFLAMVVLEYLLPKRRLTVSKSRRWLTNISIGGIDSLLVRLMAMLVIPLAAVATALSAERIGVGVFNWLGWPHWIEILLAVVLLDLAIYGQHVASHKFAILWRLHRVHHSDLDFDVTTAIRFHPIEIGLSMLYKIVLVLILGASALAVVLFEVILNGCAMFNHSNIALPSWLDRPLRLILVTPDMHRVHHSIIHRETNSNYGFNLSVWDRVFHTYRPQPAKGHEGMTIGLPEYQSRNPVRLLWSLSLPFRGPARPRSCAQSTPGAKINKSVINKP